MHCTQGTFSYLPPLSDEQIAAQVFYAIDNGWAVSIEYTDDPHPRNIYWEMWAPPMFDLKAPGPLLEDLARARAAHADSYIRISAFDARLGRQTTALSFIVNRPALERSIRVERMGGPDRQIRYTLIPQ